MKNMSLEHLQYDSSPMTWSVKEGEEAIRLVCRADQTGRDERAARGDCPIPSPMG